MPVYPQAQGNDPSTPLQSCGFRSTKALSLLPWTPRSTLPRHMHGWSTTHAICHRLWSFPPAVFPGDEMAEERELAHDCCSEVSGSGELLSRGGFWDIALQIEAAALKVTYFHQRI